MSFPRYPVFESRHSDASAAPGSGLDVERHGFRLLEEEAGVYQTVDLLREAQEKADRTVEFPTLPVVPAL